MSDSSSLLLALIYFAIVILAIVAMWKVFKKAGHPGWMSIIPILNIFVQIKIAGRPTWWFLLMLIPLVNIVIAIIISLDIAKAFGKSVVFGIFGLILFSIIGYSILAFDDSTYTQPNHS